MENKMFLIDVPSPLADGTWHEIGQFDTKEEALEFVQNAFGADEEGRICLISEFNCEDE